MNIVLLSFLIAMNHIITLHLVLWLQPKVPEEFQDLNNGGIDKGS